MTASSKDDVALARLSDLVAAEVVQPVEPRVSEMASAIAAVYGSAALGIIFYGSCLWKQGQGLDGQMLDFYLIVSDYRSAYGRGWKAFANAVLPPNVFPFAHGDLAAKYAVLSLDHLRREVGPGARDSSTYARFAQPVRLVWSASAGARQAITDAVARAAPTLLTFASPMVPEAERDDPLALWRTAFALTYQSEVRAERQDRSALIVNADPVRYRRFAMAFRRENPEFGGVITKTEQDIAAMAWRETARRGKRRQFLKLAKATTTFAGGIDYLAWKINRHAGSKVTITPWQRRLPLIAALTLLPRLWRSGAIR